MAAVKQMKFVVKKGDKFTEKGRYVGRSVQVVKKDMRRAKTWVCENIESARQTSISEKTLREKFLRVETPAAEAPAQPQP